MNTYIPLPNSGAGSPVQFSEPAAYSYESCHCCPRNCQINRTKKQGWCHSPAGIRAARAALHPWEEPCISGLHGSGTIFFSGCTLRCCFCQNYQISSEGFGKDISGTRLEEIFLELQAQGAHNINLVTPTQYLPSLLPVLKRVKPQLSIPIVYNCGGYESVETLRQLEGLVDVYLPDYKYADATLAQRLSRAADYPEIAAAAIAEMYRQTGPFQIEDGALVSGVLIRHLLLPGALDNTLDVISWVGAHFTPGQVLFSLMRQYTPTAATANLPPLDRRVTNLEYDAAVSWMTLCGIQDGFTQDASAVGEAYIPDFSPGNLKM